MPAFPDPEWFQQLGRLMETESELFRRLGYAETRFVISVLSDGNGLADRHVGVAIEGYQLTRAIGLDDLQDFDPDFAICGSYSVWRRILDEIVELGRPQLRHTLSSLALVGEELWLESTDQLREDKFYRYNQTLQEMFNLSARL